MEEVVGFVFLSGEGEVHDGDEIDVFEAVLPCRLFIGFLDGFKPSTFHFHLSTFNFPRSLVAYGLGGVIDGAFLEEGFPAVLHLNDELAPALGLAIDVEVVGAGAIELADLLDVFIDEIHDGILMVFDDGVEEADEDVFVGFGGEEFLEAIVGEGVDVTVHDNAELIFFCKSNKQF